jgi:hypothetical protein
MRKRILAQDDVELSPELSGRRFLGGFEVNDQSLAGRAVCNVIEEPIPAVLRRPLHVDLGYQPRAVRDLHGDMHMRSTSGVGYRLDSSESVPTVACGLESTVPLEVGISWHTPVIAAMDVTAVGIALPDLHKRTLHGSPVEVQHTAPQIRYLAGCEAISSLHAYQIVVFVERKTIRVEGAARLSRSRRSYGSRGSRKKQGQSRSRSLNQSAAGKPSSSLIHRDISTKFTIDRVRISSCNQLRGDWGESCEVKGA